MSLADDIILPFQVGDTAVRGRVVRLGPSIDKILSAHKFDDQVSELAGEAAALVAAMGAALKFDGKLILQMQGDGPVRMVVSDYSADGALRVMASAPRSGEGPPSRGLSALVGKGHMVLTIDQGPDMERYQGVTPLESATLEDAAVAYFDQSEQIPTAVRLAVGRVQAQGHEPQWRAGAIIAQFVPAEGGVRERGEAALKTADDQEVWDRAAAFVRSTAADELLDPGLEPETLLYRLFHEDGARVFEAKSVRAQCSCNADKIAAVLQSYDEDALAEMMENGAIRVACEFCRKTYLFDKSGREMGA